jgi:uncharacterized protein
VRGNHDRHAGDPPDSLDIACVDGPCAPRAAAQRTSRPAPSGAALQVCGHLHPTTRLAGRGGDRVRLPCFVLGPQHLILPAFSSFTGAGAWVPRLGEQRLLHRGRCDHAAAIPLTIAWREAWTADA